MCMSGIGCTGANHIDIEIQDDQPKFFINAPIWTWPGEPVRINALAVASNNESFWEIRTLTPEGIPAAGIEIRYGTLPDEFEQITPLNNGRAKDLAPGETYYIGATGPDDQTWRAVFALPVSRFGTPPNPADTAEPDPVKIDLSNPQP